MIKTILVPTSGNDTDQRVFAIALSIARPLGAHIEFFHVRLSACEAAVHSPHVEFCVGPAISNALHSGIPCPFRTMYAGIDIIRRYLNGEIGGPARTRTEDQGIHSTPPFPVGVDYLFTHVGCGTL